MNPSNTLKMTIYTALFAALIAAGAFIAIPVGPVPIVLQNMFVLMAALVLGPRWGLAAILLYLFMGACGFPVFSGGSGGLGWLFGPTGGYLLGYIPAVAVTATLAKSLGHRPLTDALAMAVGSLLVYGAGVPWLKFATGMPWDKALALGLLPFIIGDLIKIAAGTWAAGMMRRIMDKTGA
ncbi:biotin transport system substrate-specific component [Desulfocicer vacuolatum DSM 3385]|uniref:Biotin transporter n=1 Tax=Desulfocicer vacuolatum DSM 3385 TaxID=1121400 RepID=A0A1W2BRV8_9BACT|nr:biotin transporter BioY [Desulfocicer vacuolatum]SMC75725.1 biotin transport system substrate-specific component [Desulfocicer vacuolatum DSM 3385]